MDRVQQKAPEREPFSAKRVLISAIGALSIIYLAQAATPLRLDDDAVDYLNIAAAITDGRPAPNLRIPHGYSHFVSLLERGGMGSSAFFVLANCTFIAIILATLWGMRGYSAPPRLAGVIVTLLAIPVIRSVPIALPDAAFCAVFMLSLFFMARKGESAALQIVNVACAAVLTFAAINLRYAGIALLAPLVWSVFHQDRQSVGTAAPKQRTFVSQILLLLFAVAIVITLTRSNLLSLYVGDAREFYENGSLASRILNRAEVLLRSIGEIVLNLPYSRFRSFGWLYLISGIATVALAAKVIRRPFQLNAQRVCLISYLLLLALWPSPAPRLWMPIIPLIALEVAQAFTRVPRPKWLRVTAGAYAAWFSITGIAALAYTTRISFSGSNFTRVYGKNGGMPDPDIHEGDPSWSHVQYYRQIAPMLLQRYGDSRARGQ